MKAYKGFNPDLTCRGFQFAEGQTYEHDGPVRVCESGFHAVLSPLDVFNYYAPGTSVYHEVELEDATPERGDSKVAARKLTVGASINLAGLAKAHVEYVTERIDATKEQTKVGDAATNTGDRSAASVEGADSIAIVTGYHSKAAGAKGCWIVLTERDYEGHILDVRAVKIGTKPNGKRGLTVKPGKFYMLSGGTVVEA